MASLLKTRLKRKYPDLVRIVRLVAYEVGSRAAHWRGLMSIRQRTHIQSLSRSTQLKLNVACGAATKPGWVNIDSSGCADICVDLRRPIPLRTGSAAMIFCEHFCDHLNFPDEISRFLGECYRLLESGGRARFVLHDATDLMRACVERDSHYFKVAEVERPTMMEAVNFLFRFDEGHQFLYDFETFERLLCTAGFSKVKRCKYGQSDIAGLALDLQHPSREIMSMYVEAVK